MLDPTSAQRMIPPPTPILTGLEPSTEQGSRSAFAAGTATAVTSGGYERQESSGQKQEIKDSVQISEEAREIAKLAARDREVRAHEAAHAAIGGRYAGSPSLTYKKGPDGRSYAVGGEVSIDVASVSGNPLATLQKALIVRAAALAPAQPSSQDMRIASRASAMAAKARSELATQGDVSETASKRSGEDPDALSAMNGASGASPEAAPGTANLSSPSAEA